MPMDGNLRAYSTFSLNSDGWDFIAADFGFMEVARDADIWDWAYFLDRERKW